MSAPSLQKLRADRDLRDSALSLVKADLAFLQSDMNASSLSSRLMARAGDGAKDLYAEAGRLANDNRGILATLIAAIGIWFARTPLTALLSDTDDDAFEDAGFEDSNDEIYDA